MSEINRYSYVQAFGHVPDDDGKFVLHDDHAAAMAAKDAEIDAKDVEIVELKAAHAESMRKLLERAEAVDKKLRANRDALARQIGESVTLAELGLRIVDFGTDQERVEEIP